MWEKIMIAYTNLLAIGFDVRIAAIALGVYFTARQIIEYVGRCETDQASVKMKSKLMALIPTAVINFIGQLAFQEESDLLDTIIWTIGQTVGAMGFYSLAEAIHLIDKISSLIKVKFGGDANAAPPTP